MKNGFGKGEDEERGKDEKVRNERIEKNMGWERRIY